MAPQNTAEVTNLELGRAIERELSGGQKQSYQITLSEGQYATVTIDQRGIDIVARLLGADGKPLAEFDSEIRLQGQEQVEWVAETDGSYRLSVEAKQQETPAANYVIRFTELRAATEKDRGLQEARRSYAESVRLRRAGKYEEALTPGNRAFEIQEQLLGSEHPEVATALNNLAEIHRLKGDYLKAELLHKRALEIREKALGPDHPHVAYSLTNLATLAEKKGDYTQARLLGQRALEIKEKAQGPEHPDVATTINNLAALFLNSGDFNKAEQLFQRALKIKEKASGSDHPSLATTLNNLGLIYRNRGDYDKAVQLHQRALEIREKALGAEHPDVATSLNNLAAVYFYQGDYDKSEQLYQRGLEIREKTLGPEHPQVATLLNNLAELYELKGNYVDAELMIRRALQIRTKVLGAQHPEVGSSLNNLARLEQRKGNYTEAESLFRRALEIREKSLGPDHPLIAITLNNLAGLYTAKGEVDQAITSQLRSNTITERNIILNLAIGSERQKLAYLLSLARITDRTISLHLRTAPDHAQARRLAVTTILQRKGRVLDAMFDSLAALRRQFNAQDQALFDQLADATAYLAKLVLNEPPEAKLAEHQKEIKAFADRREALEGEISRRSAGFYQQVKPITLEAIRGAIPPQAALIEFAVYRPFDPNAPNDDPTFGAPRYAAYVMRNQGEVGWKDLGDAKAIDRAIDEWRQALRDPQRRDVTQLARAVDERIMRPLRPLFGDARRLLISPDGALNLIPFEALLDEQQRYLVERFACSYLTSGRDLLRLQVARASKSAPFVLANPLFGEPEPSALARGAKPRPVSFDQKRPEISKRQSVTSGADLSDVYFAPLSGTAQEAQAIKSLFAEARVLTETQATESSLKRVAAPRLLHIATHGFFLTDAPVLSSNAAGETTRAIPATTKIANPLLRSGLALAGANLRRTGGDDGILTAMEASGLNLWGTKLVTLSACDTGLGEVQNGEGVYGLRRAFVLAGAETLVMSLWGVSDYVTREMMKSYYQNLKQGLGRGEALRQVQLSLLHHKGREHPFYWASFIQSGEWANLDGKR